MTIGAGLRGGSADHVRALARKGALADAVASAPEPERIRLTGGTYEIAWPVVFCGKTQKIERRRGHSGCAISVRHLTPDCLDRFEDDVEAVVYDVVHSAKRPIANLEAWIASRLNAATVDGHRRRRGEIGALQRPRPPKWLVQALGDDKWLVHLATQMLVWVGNSATAGTELWPTESWTALRCEFTGDWEPATDIQHDIDTVLAAMRTRPNWYANYVERPLGRKAAPVLWFVPEQDNAPLELVDRGAGDDAYMRALAHEAVVAIQARLALGEPADVVVADVLRLVFGASEADLVLDRLLRDERETKRIVADVLDLISRW
jgi:hypothetical protein